MHSAQSIEWLLEVNWTCGVASARLAASHYSAPHCSILSFRLGSRLSVSHPRGAGRRHGTSPAEPALLPEMIAALEREWTPFVKSLDVMSGPAAELEGRVLAALQV